MMIKASRKNYKNLLILATFLLQILITGFVFIPVSGGSPTSGDTLIDRVQSNPNTGGSEVQEKTKNSTDLKDFVDSIVDGQASVIKGVYVDAVMEYPVVQQPSSQPGFVSSNDGIVTEFSMPKDYGVIGILAHNFAAGAAFFQVDVGDIVDVVYGDGSLQPYQVTEILEYQALSPKSPSSSFIDLDSGEQLTATQLFKRVYMGDHHLTLQTCIQVGSEDSWGRLFLIAEPLS